MYLNYIDVEPYKLPKDIFRLYQLCSIENEQNTGVMVEDGCFEFMFVKEKNVQLKIQDKPPIKLPQCFTLGKLPLPYKFIFPNSLNYFAIKVQPWASSFFFPEEYYISDLSKNYSADILELHSKIFKASSFSEMVNHTEYYFQDKPQPISHELDISKKICQKIYESRGDIKIKELIDQFPHSRQNLNDIFVRQTKNSIKEFAIYVRVREIIKHSVENENKSLTSIALEFGYFDQSHFIKDMKKVTGLTPSKFLSKVNFFSEQLKA